MNQRFIHIQRDSITPLAEQITNEILKRILKSELDAGQRLPTERELAESLGVSRGTIKRAYAKLAHVGAIGIRKGSGSYVLKNGQLLEMNQKKEATEVLVNTFSKLQDMGLSRKEILNLVHLHFGTSRNIQKINIMVVSNNYEILAELEQQLSYISNANSFLFTLSFFTLDSIENNHDPIQMLLNYDLIIATSIDYHSVIELVPMFQSKVIDATISPCTQTLIELSLLPKDARVSVLYRTQVFKSMIRKTLLSLDFAEKNIFYFFDAEYNPAHHSDNGVSVIINFNESPVYLDPKFQKRNQEFLAREGKMLNFTYRIDRKALINIEDRIQDLLDKNEQDGFDA